MRSRLTEKLAKMRKNTHALVCAPDDMATPEEKQIDKHPKMEWQSKEYSGVNLVVMNYNKRISQQWGQRGMVLRGQTAFSHCLRWQKNGKAWSGHARLRARVAMGEGLLSVWVSQSIGQLWSVNKYCYLLNSGFARTRSQILCSWLSDEQRIGNPTNVFSRTTSMNIIRKSFLLQTIRNIQYCPNI